MIVFSVYSILCSLVIIFDLVDEGIDEDAAWVVSDSSIVCYRKLVSSLVV